MFVFVVKLSIFRVTGGAAGFRLQCLHQQTWKIGGLVAYFVALYSL